MGTCAVGAWGGTACDTSKGKPGSVFWARWMYQVTVKNDTCGTTVYQLSFI